MQSNNALNFLLFCYFGIDGGTEQIKREKEKVVNLCAHRAYLDLSRTIKFRYSTSKLEQMKRDRLQRDNANGYQKIKHDLIDEICKSILSPFKDKTCSKENFNDWHEIKCKSIVEKMNHQKYENIPILADSMQFTIGQSQKWINMTLKYLWLLDSLPEDLPQDVLHIPIDGYVIKAVRSNEICSYGLGLELKLSKIPWSAWNHYEAYRNFQKTIQHKIKDRYALSPIEWEEKAWIEVAKNYKK